MIVQMIYLHHPELVHDLVVRLLFVGLLHSAVHEHQPGEPVQTGGAVVAEALLLPHMEEQAGIGGPAIERNHDPHGKIGRAHV